MSLSDAVNGAVAAFRRRPSDLLPWYVLGAAVPAIARVVPFLAVLVGVVYLEATGRLGSAAEELAAIDAESPDPEAEPEAFENWLAEFEPVVEQLFTPGIVALIAVALLLTLVVGVGFYAVVAAAQLTACSARLRANRGLTAGIAGARRYWLRFLGLFVLEIVAWIGAILVIGLIGGIVGSILVVATGTEVAALLVGLVVILAIGVALAAIRAVFAFAPVAVVVDDTTTLGGVTNAAGFVRSSPIEAGFYYAVAIGMLVGVSILSSVLAVADVVAATSLLSVLLVLPALDLLKTALYNDHRGRLAPPASPERRLRDQFRDGVTRGWREMIAFVRGAPGTHALVVVLAVGSFWIGWEAGQPLVETAGLESSIAARLEAHEPVSATLEFFGNNWLVALTTAFSGVVLAIPAIASLVFNGLVMGLYARTEVEPMELLAFVVPHGLFEVPAILIATAVGINLGVVGWRHVRGRADDAAAADALERTFWVLVGIGILLAIAAVVEGFVSPYYYDLFL